MLYFAALLGQVRVTDSACVTINSCSMASSCHMRDIGTVDIGSPRAVSPRASCVNSANISQCGTRKPCYNMFCLLCQWSAAALLSTVDDYTRQNIMVIQGKFGNLVLIVRKYLHKKLKKNKIKDLRLFILSLYPDISSPDLIPVTSDLNTIFEAMGCNQLWSYMNYFPLEQIVKQFGGDNPDMIGEIEKFKKHRAGFQLATKIKAFIPAAKKCKHEQLNPVNPEHFAKLSLILDERVADYSLKYLEELWQSLSFHMQLPPIELLFEIIDSGSIQIVFLIPTRLVPQVIHQAQYSAYFYEMHHRHVRSVTVGDYCIYESKYTEKGSLLNLAMVRKLSILYYACNA